MTKPIQIGRMNVTVHLVRRDLLQPVVGSAEPRHDYTVVFTTRAAAQTRKGASGFAQVMVGDRTVTHTFTIRFTTIPFDTRNRLRTATGSLFEILSVEDVDLQRRYLRLNCVEMGKDHVEAAR